MNNILLISVLILSLCAIGLCIYVLIPKDNILKHVISSFYIGQSQPMDNSWILNSGYPSVFNVTFHDRKLVPDWITKLKPYQILHLSKKKPKKECIEFSIQKQGIMKETNGIHFVGYGDFLPTIEKVCDRVKADCVNQLPLIQNTMAGILNEKINVGGIMRTAYNKFAYRDLQKLYLFTI